MSGKKIGQLMILLDVSMENSGLKRGLYIAMSLFALLMVFIVLLLYVLIKRSEKARIEAETELRLASEAIANTIDGVIITDEKGIMIDVNAAFEKVTGYSKAEAIGQNPSMLKSGKHDEMFYHAMWQSIHESGQWQGRILNQRKNGEIFPEHLSVTVIKDEDGVVKNYIGVFLDASEQEALELQFRQSQRMESLGTLVGGIAHEFNNMLAGMTGNLYLAMGEVSENPEVIEKLKTVESLSFQAADMITQLLAFARKGQTSTEQISLDKFICSSLELHQLAVPENINLQYLASSQSLYIDADRKQLQQVMVNLIDNAKSALAGVKSPEIRVEMDAFVANRAFTLKHEGIQGKCFARLTISDNGRGIAEQDIDKVFEPFFTTKDVGEGSGLGLSMVFGSMKAHDGAVDIDSEAGKGTSVYLYFPLLTAIADNPAGQEKIIIAEQERTILVVDDDLLVIETAKKVLERLGYRVLTASSGQDAVDIVHKDKEKIDLVMMDVVMPELSGPDTADLLYNIDRDLTVIYASGYDKTDKLEERISRTGEIVLNKPYNIVKLSHILHEIFHG